MLDATELPAPQAQTQGVTHEQLQADLRALRHVHVTRSAELASESADVRAEVSGVRDALLEVDARLLEVSVSVRTLAATVAQLERRLIPAAWSGVTLGVVVGWAVAVLLGGGL